MFFQDFQYVVKNIYVLWYVVVPITGKVTYFAETAALLKVMLLLITAIGLGFHIYNYRLYTHHAILCAYF